MNADVTVSNHGTLFLFTPHTEDAKRWIEDNVSSEASYFGMALVVEHRYAHELVAGMKDAGLEVE